MEKQLNKKVAIATEYFNVYSETFIKAQIDLLPATLVIHGGLFPQYFGNNKSIVNKFYLRINRIILLLFRVNIYNYNQALYKLLKKNNISIILAQFGPSGVALMDFCKKYKYPLIVHFHGYDASGYDILRMYEAKYLEMFQIAKKIVVVSNRMKNDLLNIGCPEEKIVLQTYGPRDLFFENTPNFEKDLFFAMGRFVDKKGPYLTLLAFIEVLKEYPKANLRMAGDGALLNTCKNLVKAYGVESNVTFLGVIKTPEIIKEMENAIAFVQHSLIADNGDSEGTPVGILEAQAAALPVISTFHAGIPDVVKNNETGFLVQELDIIGMKNAMSKLISNKVLAKKMGQEGRERVKNNFTMEMYLTKLRNVINE